MSLSHIESFPPGTALRRPPCVHFFDSPSNAGCDASAPLHTCARCHRDSPQKSTISGPCHVILPPSLGSPCVLPQTSVTQARSPSAYLCCSTLVEEIERNCFAKQEYSNTHWRLRPRLCQRTLCSEWFHLKVRRRLLPCLAIESPVRSAFHKLLRSSGLLLQGRTS